MCLLASWLAKFRTKPCAVQVFCIFGASCQLPDANLPATSHHSRNNKAATGSKQTTHINRFNEIPDSRRRRQKSPSLWLPQPRPFSPLLLRLFPFLALSRSDPDSAPISTSVAIEDPKT